MMNVESKLEAGPASEVGVPRHRLRRLWPLLLLSLAGCLTACNLGVTQDGARAALGGDADGDGWVACPHGSPKGSLCDCNDASPQIYPGAQETCNGADDDCDGSVDNLTASTYYSDADGDGHGDPNVTTTSSCPPAGYVSSIPKDFDCDDTNAARYPGNPEVCDGLDNDCDGTVDNSPGLTPLLKLFYKDQDNDGYGDTSQDIAACAAPDGYSTTGGDCNDAAPQAYPGGVDTLVDGIDADCDGIFDRISTFAGVLAPTFDPAPGSAVLKALKHPSSVAVDVLGYVYIADTDNNAVWKLDTGNLILLVGNTGTAGFGGDGGPALSALLDHPQGLAVDGVGNLYIADTGNHRVREMLRNGTIITVAGDGQAGSSGDGGAATLASLDAPTGVAVDGQGDLFIADASGNRVRRVDASSQNISTFAGTGTAGFSDDGGAASSAELSGPTGVAVFTDTLDGSLALYIADSGNCRVRKVAADGTIVTVAGTGGCGDTGDGGSATTAELLEPSAVALSSDGVLFIADAAGNRVRSVDLEGTITTAAGTGQPGYAGDGGAATEAGLSGPRGVAVDFRGNLFIADTGNDSLRKVVPGGTIATVAGSGPPGFSGDGGPASVAQFNGPSAVVLDSQGNLYIADSANARIRRVAADGTITTIAGTGKFGFSGDGGPATAAQLNWPDGLVVDTLWNLYVSDRDNHRIRKIDWNGIVTTIAGTGVAGFGGDGEAATIAQLSSPVGVAIDGAGNLFIADRDNNRVREVDGKAVIHTVAGDGKADFGGDGGSATLASLNGPAGVSVDDSGNLYIADSGNQRVRKVNAAGALLTVAGTGTAGAEGDNGFATQAQLYDPTGVSVDGQGGLFIVEKGGSRVRWVEPLQLIHTVAGSGTAGYSGDGGLSTLADLNGPQGVAVDSAGPLYIADTGNSLIRRVVP